MTTIQIPFIDTSIKGEVVATNDISAWGTIATIEKLIDGRRATFEQNVDDYNDHNINNIHIITSDGTFYTIDGRLA